LQTSRQSAYSMATRCIDELHVFLDAATQQSGACRDWDPVRALGERWTRDAKKVAASSHLGRLDRADGLDRPAADRSGVDKDLVVVPPEPKPELAQALQPRQLDLRRDLASGLGVDL